MNQKELKELIEFLIQKDITEFELERGDLKVRIKRGSEPVLMPAPPALATAPPVVPHPSLAPSPVPPPPAAEAGEEGLRVVKSPIVGTFYESPSPGSPPFVKIGDRVEVGQVLCIIEAMKLMNEIESDFAGEIVRRLVSNAQPVEYGQALFSIRVT